MSRRALVFLSLGLAACSESESGPADASLAAADAQVGDAPDATEPDASADSSTGDATGPIDAAADAAPDAPTPEDTGPDVATDVVPDAPDAPADAAPDVPEPSDAMDTADPDVEPPAPSITVAALPLAKADFPLGVQAADPTTDGALLWTRHTGFGPLRWYVLAEAPDAEPAPILASGTTTKDPDGFVVVALEGLPPGTPMRYLFTNDVPADDPGATRSHVGRFVTAPAPTELQPVTVGATSCVDVDQVKPWAIGAAAAAPLDLFVWLGDTVYADGAKTLDEYRAFWTASYETAEYKALHAATAHAYTWDDHEVENNWDPERISADQLAAATQAFFEHAPMRHPEDAPDRIWRSIRWGATLEVFILDCRSERLPSTKGGEDATYISQEQLAWLIDGVQTSDAVFKLIANSVPITNMPPIYVGDEDRWEGYDAQRDAVLAAIGDVPGVVWLAGDFHFASVNGIEPPDHALGDVWEILAGPGAKLQNPAWLVIGQGLFKDQFLWLDGTNNTVRLHFDPYPEVPVLTVEFVDGAGTVLHTQTLVYPQ